MLGFKTNNAISICEANSYLDNLTRILPALDSGFFVWMT